MESTSSKVFENVSTKEKSSLKDCIKFLVSVFIIYLVVSNSIGITRVMGHSMDPSLKDGSYLFVNKLSTFISKPNYGDVVIVQEGNYQIVKRIIGVPGDTVAIQKGILYINNRPIPEVYKTGITNDMTPVTVSKGQIFIMGDNRTPGASLDSRDPSIGPVSDKLVRGYAVISLLPFYKITKP